MKWIPALLLLLLTGCVVEHQQTNNATINERPATCNRTYEHGAWTCTTH